MSLRIRHLPLAKFVAVTSILAASLAFAQETDTSDRAFERVESSITDKQSLRADKERERERLRDEIASVETELADLQAVHAQLKQQLDASEREIASQSSKAADQIKTRADKTTQLIWSAVTSHQLKERNPITMLVVQNDPLKVDRLYHYHRYFVKQLERQIDELRVHLAELDQLLADTEVVRVKFAVVQQNFDANSASLQNRQTHLTSLNNQLQGEIEALDRDLAQLFREREQLSLLIAARTIASARDQPPPTPGTRDDITNWPTIGEVNQQFGALRADGRIRSEGIVISATESAPVTAVAPGTVVFAQWFEGYGNTVIVDHGDEVISIYAFCQSLLKQTNEPVEGGEVIATVGTDAAGGIGLYFEIRVRNKPTDPLQWLREL